MKILLEKDVGVVDQVKLCSCGAAFSDLVVEAWITTIQREIGSVRHGGPRQRFARQESEKLELG